MGKEILYGILMERSQITPQVYVFKPIKAVEGYTVTNGKKKLFVTKDNHYYYLDDDKQAMQDGETQTVFYPTAKKDILAKYGKNNALTRFYNDKVHLLNEAYNAAIKNDAIRQYEGYESESGGIVPLQGEAVEEVKPQLPSEQSIPYHQLEQISYTKKKINVHNMAKFLNKTVIGQEQVKKDIIVGFFNNNVNKVGQPSCLFVGPTGVGKHTMAFALTEYLDVPIVLCDIKDFINHKYEMENLLIGLIMQSTNDIARAQRGIILIDGISRDISINDSVKKRVDELFEKTTYNVNFGQYIIPFDTSSLIILGIATFDDVAKKSTIGYIDNSVNYKPYQSTSANNITKQNYTDLLVKFSIFTYFNELTKEDFRKLLTNILNDKKAALKDVNIDLRWTKGFLDAIIDKAIELKQGAKSLSFLVENAMHKSEWEVLHNKKDYAGICYGKKAFDDYRECILITKDGKEYTLKDIMESKVRKIGGRL